MYKKFNDYLEQKEDVNFDWKFNTLCESISRSGIPFDVYWENHALPALLESSFSNETELFNEFGNMNWFDPTQRQASPQQEVPASPIFPDDSEEIKRQAKLSQYQNTVNQDVQKIKNEFVKQMRDFLGAMQTDAKRNNHYIGWKIAKAFYDRLMKTAQPVIDNFAMKAKFGKRNDSDFQKGVEGMRQQRQNQIRSGDARMAGPKSPIPGPVPNQSYSNIMNRAAMSPQ